MFTKHFWIDAVERTLATFVQVFAATLVVTDVTDTKALQVATLGAVIAAGKAAVTELTGAIKTAGPDA